MRSAVALLLLTTAGLLASTAWAAPPFSLAFASFGPAAAANFTLTRTAVANNVLELTPSPAQPRWSGAAKFAAPMLVRGFDTSFTVEVLDFAAGGGHDGVAFVIVGPGETVTTGTYGGGLGYGDLDPAGLSGIPNSWAVELDTFRDINLGDPASDHISVHSAGTAPNSADESSPARLCPILTGIVPIATTPSKPYSVRLRYEPPFGWDARPDATATLTFWTEGIATPVAVCHLDRNHTIDALLDLGPGGEAYLMFTAATDDTADVHTVLDWSFDFLGAPNGNTSVASGPGLIGGTAGDDAVVTVQLHDQYGFVYPRGAADVECEVVLDADPPIACTPGPDGTLTASYSTTTAGDHTLAIRIDGYNVVGSPFAVAWSPGPVDPAASTFSGVPTSLVAGAPGSFVVNIVDEYGNVVDDGSLTVVAHLLPAASSLSFTAVYSATTPGQYDCTFTLALAGPNTVSVSINTIALDGGTVSPVDVQPGPVDAASSLLSGAGLTNAVAGMPATFFVALVDAYGNRVDTAGEQVAATLKHDAIDVAVTVDAHASGNYSAEYTATKTGAYDLEVDVGSDSAAPATFTSTVLVVSDGVPAPSHCVASGSGLSTERGAGDSGHFHVTPRDKYDNLVSNNDVTLDVTITPDTGARVHWEYDHATGNYNVDFDVTLSGAHTIDVTVNGGAILGSPFSVNILPGSADPTASVVRASSGLSSTVTDRTEVFTVYVEDQYGNIIANLGNNTVAAYITGPHDYPVVCVENPDANDSAVVHCSYSISKTGTYSLHVLVDGVDADGSPFRITVAWAHTTAVIVGVLVTLAVLIGCVVFAIAVRKRAKRSGFTRL